MLYEDEDDIFVGSPRSKFFDIMFNANRNLVEDALEKHAEKYVAMEMLLEKYMEKDGLDMERVLYNMGVEQQDEIHNAKRDFYMTMVTNILTQNE